MTEIKTGQAVDIVVEKGIIRRSFIQDIVDGKIILLQITPPLSALTIGKTILVTYLPADNRCTRLSFQARIVECREGYVTVGRGFPVIIAESISPIEPCDLRAYERHQPEPMMKVMFESDNLEIIDISDTGAHLVRSTSKKPPLKLNDAIPLTIQRNVEIYCRRAKIVRQWHTRGKSGPEHLAVIFVT